MGRIIRNGVEYGSGNENATNINYDGSVSGLEATTVQAAVDEVVSGLGGIEFAIVDGKPQWKERGADSFSPFNSGSNINSKLIQTGYSKNSNAVINLTASEDIEFGIISTSASYVSGSNPVDPGTYTVTLSSGTAENIASYYYGEYSGCRNEVFIVRNVTAGSTITLTRSVSKNVGIAHLIKLL